MPSFSEGLVIRTRNVWSYQPYIALAAFVWRSIRDPALTLYSERACSFLLPPSLPLLPELDFHEKPNQNKATCSLSYARLWDFWTAFFQVPCLFNHHPKFYLAPALCKKGARGNPCLRASGKDLCLRGQLAFFL